MQLIIVTLIALNEIYVKLKRQTLINVGPIDSKFWIAYNINKEQHEEQPFVICCRAQSTSSQIFLTPPPPHWKS